MQAKLRVLSGKQAGREVELRNAQFVIGRDAECDLRPASADVSRRHCIFTVEPSAVFVEDLHSANGTFVNQIRITGRRQLAAGDSLRVGNLSFAVLLETDQPAASAPAKTTQQPSIAKPSGRQSSQKDINSEGDILQLLDADYPEKQHSGFIQLASLLPPSAQDTSVDASNSPTADSWPDFAAPDALPPGKHMPPGKMPNKVDTDDAPDPLDQVDSQSAAFAAIELFRQIRKKFRS